MTMHLSAYRSLADQAGANAALTAVIDQAVNTEGTFIRVPNVVPQLLAEAFFAGAITAFTRARVESPSLRTLANQMIATHGLIADDDKDFRIQWHGMSPRELRPGEGVEFVTNTDAVAAVELHGLIWLGDGPVQRVGGNQFTTRATAAIATVNTGWTAGILTFDERLPIADYDVVGLMVTAADGTAARLVFPGLPFRPGVVVVQDESTNVLQAFRYGNAGVFGRFNLNQPPQLEVFGGAGGAQVVYLDLIRV